MYLKSIELYGFKSFADRTKIEFNDSLTCIVGPNGSGKSNITDAIQWVLGEQSSLALRGDSMSDVIFKGTDHRRPLGLAEVIITFDNSSEFLDIDFQTVEVKRKLYKNGDSEYYINNSSCRLKDIRNLFMDTGIGRDGYSIIGQGKIDSILNSKPVERKAIFEEASGISKQKSEKKEVEKKLLKTQDNLTRIKDIISEIKSQRDSLEKQAEKAEKYKSIYENMKTKDILVSAYNLLSYKDQLNKININYGNYNDEYESNKGKINKYNLELEDKSNKLEEIDSKINQYQAINIENIRKEKDINNSIDINNEKIKSLEKENIELEIRIDDLVNKNEKNKSSITDLKEKAIDFKNNIGSLEKSIEKDNESLGSVDNSLDTNIKSLNECENKLNEFIILESKLDLLKENVDSSKENRDSNIENLKNKISKIEKNNKLIVENKIIDENNIRSNEKKLDHINKEIDKINSKSKEVKVEKDTLISKQLEVDREINSKEARYQSLKNLEENYEGYNKSIRSFFSFINKNNIKIPELYDTVANIIKVDKKYEEAISNVLGAMTQNLVVESFSSAQKIIRLLDKNKLGRITFLPLDNLKVNYNKKPINEAGFIDYGSNLVSYDEKFTIVVEFLLGKILVVDNLENARNISKKYNNKIVTLNGEIIYPGGSLSGGKNNYSNNIFTRKNELENLYNDLVKLNTSSKELKERLELLTKEENNLNKKYTSYKDDVEEINREISIYKNNLYEHNINQENNQEKIAELKSQINSYNEILEKDYSNYKNIYEQIDKNSKEKGEINQLIDDLNKVIEEANKEKELLSKKLDENKNSLTKLSTQLEYTLSSLDDLEDDLRESKSQTKTLEVKYQDNLSNINLLKEESLDLSNKLEELNNNIKEFSQSYDKIKVDRENVNKDYDNISNILKEIRNKNFEVEKTLIKLENSIKNINNNIKSIVNNIGENYNITLIDNENVKNISKELLDEYKAQLKDSKGKLKKLGSVDLSSINRFNEINERYEFNLKQYEDMVNSKEKLEVVLEDITELMEDKFVSSFKTINEKFSKIFTYMFNGGRAQLVLVNQGEEDQFGVDIIAELPGKKKQGLNALSGGERSMTAVSLLFAFLETRPAPFCLLDEVDAALDEGNIGRFTEYLKKLDNIQFALITHRTRTMESAEYIYGVTMEEPGVSKLVSLKF